MKMETKCIRSGRAGRFKVSLLRLTKTFQQPGGLQDFVPERTVEQYRVAIQYSRKVNEEWKNETIYCTTEDFKNLQNAMDNFQEGDETSLSLDSAKDSRKVHALVQYIKANDFLDLDSMDLKVMDSDDVLRHLGIRELKNEGEVRMFIREVRHLAEEYQTQEIVRSVLEA